VRYQAKPPHERADVVGLFPGEPSIIQLLGAMLLEANDEWQLQHRYMQVETMAELLAPDLSARSIFPHVDGRDPTYYSWKVRNSSKSSSSNRLRA